MGVPVTLSGRLTRAAAAASAAAGAATVAAGCGSQVATTSSATQPASPTASPAASSRVVPCPPGSSALCSKQAAVTRLVVSRVSALPQNHLHFAFPAGVTVSSPARARAVAAAVCGLPADAQRPHELPCRHGPWLPAQLRRRIQELPGGHRQRRRLRGCDRGRPGALDSPLAGVLDRPGPRHGHRPTARRCGAPARPGPAPPRSGPAPPRSGHIPARSSTPPRPAEASSGRGTSQSRLGPGGRDRPRW